MFDDETRALNNSHAAEAPWYEGFLARDRRTVEEAAAPGRRPGDSLLQALNERTKESIRMTRIRVIPVLAAIALVAGLTGRAVAGGDDSHAPSKGGFVIEDTCIGPPDGFGVNPASGQATPDAPPAIADVVAGRCEITAIAGRPAGGRIGFTATVYDARGGNPKTVDHGAFILSNGTIYAQGDGDLAVEQSGAPKTLAITGGTGAYEGAEGVVIDELISEEPNGDQRFRDTVRFTD